MKAVRRATGATVNDVLLATVALMLSEYLGDDAPEKAVALVPVSVRTDEERGELGNRISTVFVDLPLRGEPLERVRQISRGDGRGEGVGPGARRRADRGRDRAGARRSSLRWRCGR